MIMIKNKNEINIILSEPLSSDYKRLMETVFSPKEVNFHVFDPKIATPNINFMLLTGGEDVNPEFYGETMGNRTSCNLKRDEIEAHMYHLYRHIPKLGICRGSQFLTVMAGGKLIQDVNGHGGTHTIQTGFGMPEGHFKNYPMSSTHHQMMYPFTLPKSKYKLIAWSEYYLSNSYLNGKNQSIELPDDFLEPEIVFYPNEKSLAIQGHPEFNGVAAETVNLVKILVNNLVYNGTIN